MKQVQLLEQREFNLFGIKIHNLTMRESIALITGEDCVGRTQIGFFVNAHSINQTFENPSLRSNINAADFVFADGIGMRLAAQQAGVVLKDNVNGTDMLLPLCQSAKELGQSVFLLGAAPGIAEQARQQLKLRFPGLNLVGAHHGFLDDVASRRVINEINDLRADIVLVGMGTPIQEDWIMKYQHLFTAKTVLAVGGLFDFYSGRIPRAPQFMRNIGLEWFWRLLQEPRKKFHRYVIGNPLFLYRTLMNVKGV